MVPFRSAITLFGTPALISDCAPMMLRVRPAQLTTTRVSGVGATSCTNRTSSAPGQSTPPGMLIARYSSIGLLSRTTSFSPASSFALSSCALRLGVSALCSTTSPKALLGTCTPENNSYPAACHAATPPASVEMSLYPKRIMSAAARSARPSASSISTTRVERRGTSTASSSSSRLRDRGVAKSRWLRAKTPSSRTSSSASSRPSRSIAFT